MWVHIAEARFSDVAIPVSTTVPGKESVMGFLRALFKNGPMAECLKTYTLGVQLLNCKPFL